MKKINIYLILLSFSLITSSCKNFLDLQPIDSPTETNFYVDEKGLQGGLTACYDAFQQTGIYGANMCTLGEVRGDNVMDNNPGGNAGVTYQIETFSEKPDNTVVQSTWLAIYNAIYRSNIVVQKASGVSMDETRKKQIVGQAQFLRALSNFNLVRIWGKAPLVLTTQSSEEARKNKRNEIADIYKQIEADLNAAIGSLPASWPDAERGKATSYASSALLAKVYLYQKKYSQAATILQPIVTVINEGKILSLVPQTATFPNGMKTSKDIIFSILYLSGGIGESANQNNRYRNQDNGNMITLPQSLFEAGDNRKALLAPTGNGARPGKFDGPQVNNETSMDMPVLRCAEVMLMYAEALNESATFPSADAFAAINAVRKNAGISEINSASVTTKTDFTTALMKERRLELALECDRWFDIARTGQMSTIFPLVSAFKQFYPIPQTEIDNMTDKTDWQNTGY
jgi:starch-binding outer membrane protein, SusD/RagB family